MHELAAAQKRVEDLQAVHVGEVQKVWDFMGVTPHVTESLIKLIILQLSPDARLNEDTKVWNQIQRQRFKTSSSI
jgi:hypothetical protein